LPSTSSSTSSTSSTPFVVVGLGNPGPKYARTPHNLGFRVVDELARRWKVDSFTEKFNGSFAKLSRPGLSSEVILFKPMTFMNLSGDAVQPLCAFFKVDVSDRLVVLVDDLDTPKAEQRLRLSGGSGGHNGLVSLIDRLGTDKFPRLRLGIGRHEHIPPEQYVLSLIPAAEEAAYGALITEAADAVERCLTEGVAKAMNTVNVRKAK
jgi:peptidyl-tRNA hydrolase, PTH1 family